MLKVLAISDEEQPAVERPDFPERYGEIDVVLSCGDLPYTYMEHIATLLPVRCLYVHGNHDRDQLQSDGHYLKNPGGWQNIDGTTVVHKGWIIGGLEGCIQYRPNALYQYTEEQLRWKVFLMFRSMLLNRIIHKRYIDILITHAPPYGIHDGDDLPHRGFQTLLTFMQKFQPQYLLHGHSHRKNIDTWRTTFEHTDVVNIFPLRRMELRQAGRT